MKRIIRFLTWVERKRSTTEAAGALFFKYQNFTIGNGAHGSFHNVSAEMGGISTVSIRHFYFSC